MTDDTTPVTLPLDPGWADIREGVRRICERFPNEYWVKLDHEGAYPAEFVRALTEAGYRAALTPEERAALREIVIERATIKPGRADIDVASPRRTGHGPRRVAHVA